MTALAQASYPQTSGDRVTQLLRENAALRAELDTARETIAELKALAISGSEETLLRNAGFSECETRLLGVLLTRESASHQHLMYSLYHDDDEKRFDRLDNNVKVHMTYIRRALMGHGVQIESLWGFGYRMPAESKAQLREIIKTQTLHVARRTKRKRIQAPATN